MKRFLILQLRPEVKASDDEYQAFLAKGHLGPEQVHRIRLDCEDIPQDLDLADYSGVIVGGGPGCVSDPPSKKSAIEARIEAAVMGMLPQICAQDIPFMGCCYGIGVLGAHLGGRVDKSRYFEEVGISQCAVTQDGAKDAMLDGVPAEFGAFVGHKEALQELPEGCVHLVSSPTCPYQMIRFGRNVYATQFHPEADSEGFEVRIGVYKDRGYFAPEDAGRLIDMCRAAEVHAPELILRNFVKAYARD